LVGGGVKRDAVGDIDGEVEDGVVVAVVEAVALVDGDVVDASRVRAGLGGGVADEALAGLDRSGER
jgi:hypothetical protein